MIKTIICILLLLISFSASVFSQHWQPPLSASNPAITTPASFLGYPLGKWHLRHDQINYYLQQLARESPRVSLEDTGFSHEDRRQLTAVISSNANQQKLSAILAARSQVKQGKNAKGPLVIWLAYSIHGDEASGAHAAIALSYYLSASREPWVTNLLEQAVVLITPTQNPDGFDKFATWVNAHKGKVLVGDNASREHNQHWPRGRFNHYFADLNRDWLFAVHPETWGRVALFHKWQPHYVGDFHEMSHQKTYFFQPGVPERTHPLTPASNQLLTEKLANFHRKALDDKHQPYFSKQAFDDFFYGKGSTYPDINGSIGVLFEQASARGQIQDSSNGSVSFKEAITNHFDTSISSLKAVLDLGDELKQYQQEFFKGKNTTEGNRLAGILVKTHQDPARRDNFAALLKRHHIQYFYLTEAIESYKVEFHPNDSLFIPELQPQKALVQAMFDKRTEFADTTFYDISSFDLSAAWRLQLSLDIRVNRSKLANELPVLNTQLVNSTPVAYILDWQHTNAAPMLQQMLAHNLQVKFATSVFGIKNAESVKNANKTQRWPRGSLMIPAKQKSMDKTAVHSLIQTLATQFSIPVASTNTFAATQGSDLGSSDFKVIKPVEPLLVAGAKTDTTEVGQIWHYLDNQLGIATPLVDAFRLSQLDLSQYSHIIFASGDYYWLDKQASANLHQFVKQGGTIIAQKSALNWLNHRHLLKANLINPRIFYNSFDTKGLTFADKDSFDDQKRIGGAIVKVKIDPSHPLLYGMSSGHQSEETQTAEKLALMKDHVMGFRSVNSPFIVAAHYADQILQSGFMALEYQQQLSDTPAMLVETLGKGQIVAFTDNLLFRNIWKGSEKPYANALFFIPSGMR